MTLRRNAYIRFVARHWIIVGCFCLSQILVTYSFAFGNQPVVVTKRIIVKPASRPFGTVVVTLPQNYRLINVRGINYYYHGGYFYKKHNRGYVLARPPVGAIIVRLPVGYRTMVIGGVTYYHFENVFYKKVPSGFLVIEKPDQVVIDPGPQHNQTFVPVHPGDRVRITTDLLNVRSGPGRNFQVIRQVSRNAIFEVVEISSNWLYIKLPDQTFGWVKVDFTKKVIPGARG